MFELLQGRLPETRGYVGDLTAARHFRHSKSGSEREMYCIVPQCGHRTCATWESGSGGATVGVVPFVNLQGASSCGASGTPGAKRHPQCLHTLASARMVSAQSGHFFV